MRISIISDIHGNCVALDAVLADLKHESSIDQIVCLGDAIQGGPQPAQVVARLRELACPVVMGNADDWLLYGEDSGAEPIAEARRVKMEAVREWQLAQLSDEDREFITSFKPTIQLTLGVGQTLLAYHGSPLSFDDIILPLTSDEIVREWLQPKDDVIYTGGHTHIQFMRHFGQTFHFNPGSVGFAYRHNQPEGDFHADGWAEYAILSVTPARNDLTFRRVPFDVQALIDIYATSGRPHAADAIEQYRK